MTTDVTGATRTQESRHTLVSCLTLDVSLLMLYGTEYCTGALRRLQVNGAMVLDAIVGRIFAAPVSHDSHNTSTTRQAPCLCYRTNMQLCAVWRTSQTQSHVARTVLCAVWAFDSTFQRRVT